MNPGRYRQVVEIEQLVQTGGGSMGPTFEWVSAGARRCHFAHMDSGRRQEYQQLGHNSVTGTIHFNGPITLSMDQYRLKYQGAYYRAVEKPINPDGLNREWQVAVEVATNG